MPLKKGKSKKAFDANVSELRKTGRELDQALAIAYDVKRRGSKKARRKSK